MEIILYAPGAGGDLVTASIDPRGYAMKENHIIATFPNRSPLRNISARFLNYEDYDKIIQTTPFNSLSSHNFQYHITRKHDFILIDSSDIEYAEWATERYNNIYGVTFNKIPVEAHFGSSSGFGYSKRVIKLQDILEGKMIKQLENLTDLPIFSDFYEKWLTLNKFLIKT